MPQELTELYRLSEAAGLLFCGGVSVLAFFIFYLLLKNREKIYLHYSLFLIFILLYSIFQLNAAASLHESIDGIFRSNKRLIEPVTILSFSFYIFFAIELMAIKAQNKKLSKLLSNFAYGGIIYAIIYFLTFPYFSSFEQTIFLIARVIIFPLSLFCIAWIQLKIKSPLKVFFMVGSIAYFIGSAVATVRHSVNDLPFPAFYKLSSPIYFEMGVSIEILCFALALGYRISLLDQEKQQVNEKLIHQLSINERMVGNMNKKLEKEVVKRTKEILVSQSQLAVQQEQRLNAEYQRELAESEIIARRLQINPHFIFNSLNAIKYLIQTAQNEKATLYLGMFSKFIRMVLNSSEKNVIPLRKEIEIIENYIKLEKERFADDFSYEIHINGKDALTNTSIPPLILQPFVENAIWHGLLNSPKMSKMVYIEITSLGEDVFIIIDDNGIGRKEANHYSIKNLSDSKGLSLTKERIKFYNHNFKNTLNFEIVDKIDKNGLSLGTRVQMSIKGGIINN